MKFYITLKNDVLKASKSLVNSSHTQIVHDLVNVLKNNKDMNQIGYAFFDEMIGLETTVVITKES